MVLDLSDKKALIIEDMAEARILQKKMLGDFGFKDIDVAMKAETAIELLRSRHYDVVLSDYNLGNGKDGQQLLEEVRYSDLIPNTSTYLMVTAETSIEMVMGAIEYQPDGYITKPFSHALLQRRLVKLLETKTKLEAINQALDKKDYETAITESNSIIEQYPYLDSKCNRTKGDCYLALEQYDQAIELFLNALKEHKMPWALFGLAKSYYYQRNYEEAEPRFRQLMLDNRFFVNAYDWLAKCLIEQGKLEEAQETLIEAIGKSPKAILRQIELGKLCLRIQDFEMAEITLKRATFLAKHSVHNNADIYINHLKAFLGLAEADNLQPKQLDGFKTAVAKAHKQTERDPSARAQVYQVETEFHIALGDLQSAKNSFSMWDSAVQSGETDPPSKEFESACKPLLGLTANE